MSDKKTIIGSHSAGEKAMVGTAVATLSHAAQLPAAQVELIERARDYAAGAKSESTRKSYDGDWTDFTTWCAAQGFDAMPATPSVVGLFLADRASVLKPSSLSRRLAAISVAHRQAGHHLDTRAPQIRDVMTGIRRSKAQAGVVTAKKTATVSDDIRAMVGTLAESAIGTRDRALLLLGFAGAFRRSELVALDAGDVAVRKEGLAVTIRVSKTDQEGVGRQVAICYGADPATCPVRAVKAWLARVGSDGPLFRSVNKGGAIGTERLSDKAVVLVVKRTAEAAGLDPAAYAGHSLRSGFATTAARNGASEAAIMRQTGHRSVQVVRGYIREGGLFNDTAAAKLGL
jgi:site-specific recombinase XerD